MSFLVTLDTLHIDLFALSTQIHLTATSTAIKALITLQDAIADRFTKAHGEFELMVINGTLGLKQQRMDVAREMVSIAALFEKIEKAMQKKAMKIYDAEKLEKELTSAMERMAVRYGGHDDNKENFPPGEEMESETEDGGEN